MSKRRNLIYFILLGFFLCAFSVGSFFDYQISEAMFCNKNTFGLVISVLGTIPGYGLMAFIGGGAVAYGLRKEYKSWTRVVFFISAAACYFAAVYFTGREFFGANGFTGAAIELVGFAIMVPVMAAVSFLGYRITSKCENKDIWILYLIILITLIVAFVPGCSLIKTIFHRPRFRSIMAVADLDFYPWYVPCSNYKTLMNSYELVEEEFKSFPSGHSCVSLSFPLVVLFLPYVKKEYEKYVLPLFICGLVWSLLVMFCRILVGAHFLSDVSMGAIVSVTCMLIASIVIKTKGKPFVENINE